MTVKDLWDGHVDPTVAERFAILKQHTQSFSKRYCGACNHVVSAVDGGRCEQCGGVVS